MARRRRESANNQQGPLSSKEFEVAAQFMMAASEAHLRASVLCTNESGTTPPTANSFFLGVVSFELALLSVEQSLRLLLLLHCSTIYKPQAHDPHAIYKMLKSKTRDENGVRQDIVNLMNSTATQLNIDPFSEHEVETCLKKHRLSYSTFRYFGLTTQLKNRNWEITVRDRQLVPCLSEALISLNVNKMTILGIGIMRTVSQISELEMTPEQKSIRDRMMGRTI